ncbi:hypothetical protein [Lactococcus lactis]|uniref:hypothetical protein n=1 Tax=Lactococcus lactis TaxID=1358 RepID=UPI002892273E|nr:hypothetical protein [Lactococcus lactis]MDT2897157.1 hypothetical protein [Lactococcus lactis]MDT2948222.1 hypothetical protein [Lactococcus lactis]MDT2969416.1 hypothetical protein [Lactococcus lactis]
MKKYLTSAIQLVFTLALLRVALSLFNRLLPEIIVLGGLVSAVLLVRAWHKHRKDWW